MKCNLLNHLRKLAASILLLAGVLSAAGQDTGKVISGSVLDENGVPMAGVSVVVPGSSAGTSTDKEGRFSFQVPGDADRVEVAYVGYGTQTILLEGRSQLAIRMEQGSNQINEVVVIGYGTQRKSDLTGSIATVSTKDFNTGTVNSPEQLINGKLAGVQIVSGGGSVSGGSTIRIRGGASLNASNDPLIVVDGVPLESGSSIDLINPNDIESMTVLKDASSTAIYGSRASNGVLLITTKKAVKDRCLQVSFSTTQSLLAPTSSVDVLSAEEYRALINREGNADQKALLGTGITSDWYDEATRYGFVSDQNLSLGGNIARVLPFRASVGYNHGDGIVKSDRKDMGTVNLVLSPSFFEDHLKVTANAKYSHSKNHYATNTALWNAAVFNPTLPVYSGKNAFGGFTEGVIRGVPEVAAVLNPVGLLEQRDDQGKYDRFIGNFDVDYKMHFLPELRAHITMGYDEGRNSGWTNIPATSAQAFTSGGSNYAYGPINSKNKLFTSYLNYNKSFDKIKSTVDATAGYDFQKWSYSNPATQTLSDEGAVLSSAPEAYSAHTLISFYGRLNYAYDSRYMATFTIRRDGTSRFNPDNRWGTFPSAALAWRISKESFLRESRAVSELKLRLSYGVTGQQDGIGNYAYLAVYTAGQPEVQYPFGGAFYTTLRPEAYDQNIKWETTTAYNAGLDFGFLRNRLTGSVDLYSRQTEDLLATVPVPAGTNFDKFITTNVGNVKSRGVELSLTAIPVDTRNWKWSLSANATWQQVEITNLNLVPGGASPNTLVGPTVDGKQVQVFTEGYAPYSFYVYKQLYNQQGQPVEGAYADLDGSGDLGTGDLYRYHSPAPDWMLGFSTSVDYKRWNLSTSLRANIGNYAYNAMAMNTGAWETVSYKVSQINNLHSSYLDTGFKSRQYYSDYYVENASFLKMDNLTLSYNFDLRNVVLRVSAIAQNVFTITKYTGVDPEIYNGVDQSFYPRPRIFSLGVALQF